MNDDRSPIDDELLSAVLDGEATAEERALVEGSPDALARLEHDLAGATSDLDTADQQLKAARTEATTDPRG